MTTLETQMVAQYGVVVPELQRCMQEPALPAGCFLLAVAAWTKAVGNLP